MEAQRYEMTQDELGKIMEASRPVRYMIIGGSIPQSPQDNANAAWAELGSRMGFDYMTVRPTGEGPRFFSAVPKPDEAAVDASEEDTDETELMNCDDVIQQIANALAEADGDFIERIANSVLIREVRYLGDGMFEYVHKSIYD